MFIGREQELQFLDEKYMMSGGQLIILYGRRRIGKTETLHRFCEGKPHIFYTCREIPDAKQLAALSERILRAGSPAANYISTFQDWESAFKGMLDLPTENAKKLLVIDEFPYICRNNPSIPSILQVLWDETLKNSNIMIVLCGSAMRFMEEKILSEKSPLYGRATGIYKMNELSFSDAVRFFPDYSPEDKMLAFSILGGIPHYLAQFNPALSLQDNIIRNVLSKGCALYSEVEFLLRQELRETAFYNAIIEAVAFGNTQLNDIYTKTQINKTKISVYLKNLIDLRIISRDFSVLSGKKEKAVSTRGLYRITDHFFRFWYSFVVTNLSDLEIGDAAGVFTHAIKPMLNDYASLAFEMVCREFLRGKNRSGELPFRINKLGRWWGKINRAISVENGRSRLSAIDSEIDIVAMDTRSKNYILGECKFRNSVMDTPDLDKLKAKSEIANRSARVQYALFSKSGFSKALTTLAENDESLLLYTLSDIVAD